MEMPLKVNDIQNISPIKKTYDEIIIARDNNIRVAERQKENCCQEYACQSKKSMQAEIIEQLIKDKDIIAVELEKLRNQITQEVRSLTEIFNIDGVASSWEEQLKIVKN